MDINYGNVFSGEKEDRVEDVNLEVMRRMDDISLSNFCQTSPYYKGLCENIIWLERINAVPGLSLLLPYRSHYKDLEDFYFNIRNDAQYVVMFGIGQANSSLRVSNNISNLWNNFLKIALDTSPQEYSEEELLRFHGQSPQGYHVRITVRFNGIIDYEQLDQYTIYSNVEGTPGYLNRNILSYPLLKARDIYCAIVHVIVEKTMLSTFPHVGEDVTDQPVYEWVDQKKQRFSFVNLDDESLRQVHRLGNNIRLFFKLLDNSVVADYSIGLNWMQSGFLNTGGDNNTTLLLVDYSLLGLQPSNYTAMLSENFSSSYSMSFEELLKSTPEKTQKRIQENFLYTIANASIIAMDNLVPTLRLFGY